MAHSTLLLDAHLKALHLPTFLREYDKVARHCAQEGLGAATRVGVTGPVQWGHAVGTGTGITSSTRAGGGR